MLIAGMTFDMDKQMEYLKAYIRIRDDGIVKPEDEFKVMPREEITSIYDYLFHKMQYIQDIETMKENEIGALFLSPTKIVRFVANSLLYIDGYYKERKVAICQ